MISKVIKSWHIWQSVELANTCFKNKNSVTLRQICGNHFWSLANFGQHHLQRVVSFLRKEEFGTIQKCVNIVDLENAEKMNVPFYLWKRASIQPRASPPKFAMRAYILQLQRLYSLQPTKVLCSYPWIIVRKYFFSSRLLGSSLRRFSEI